MEASISQVVHDFGQKLAMTTGSFVDAVNQTLNKLLAGPFHATMGFVRDAQGRRTDIFGSVIYRTSQSQPMLEPPNFDADSVACVIDVDESLEVENIILPKNWTRG